MRWAHRIGKDALSRMKSVRALGRKRLFRLAPRRGFGFGSFHFHQGEVGDGAGPGKLGIIEFVKVSRGGGKTGGRHDNKNDMPQCSRYQSTAGDAALDPAFLEEAAIQKVLRDARPGQDSGDAAEDALVERAPGHVELWALARFEAAVAGGRFGCLSQEIWRAADVVQRHFRFVDRTLRGRVAQ